MARLSLRSIKAEVTALGIEKVGYTAYYVDGTNGSDSYDGLTWETAFATIQHAVDESESWAKIYVKSGTYVENVTINKENIKIIGEKKENTIISPTSNAVHITSSHVTLQNLDCIGGEHFLLSVGIIITGDHCKIISCKASATGTGLAHFGIVIQGGHNIIDQVVIDNTSAVTYHGIRLYHTSVSKYNVIKNCKITVGGWGIFFDGNMHSCKAYDNEIYNCRIGLGIRETPGDSDVHYNNIYHNIFINNSTSQVEDNQTGTTNKFWENFYDDHTTDTNNDGLCDTPYTFTTGTDYSPVSKRNGWLQESLGMTPSSSITIANIFNAINAILTLTETGATITTDGTIQTIYINNAPAGVFEPKTIQIDFTNQTATETVIIREWYRIKSGGGYIEKDNVTFAGVQSPLLKNVILEDNRFGVKVTIEKTGGTNRDYVWEVFYEI